MCCYVYCLILLMMFFVVFVMVVLDDSWGVCVFFNGDVVL